ncbi:MAG TPA: 4'-phosphopantetheinyl transferase superfamily protein [Polyangiaceae bacterium]|nr:4'-phosphopantetheinyl transferase superfamily protein [Polyangiaceae bacterium]
MFDDALPGDFAVETGDPRQPSLPLFPEEQLLVSAALDKRRLEFSRGRQCARSAMRRLGVPDAPLLSGSRREPLWPAGVIGSITHTHGLCVAAVALQKSYAGVGIDVEPDAPLSRSIAERIATAGELSALESMDSLLAARLIFSAKEAFYKSQFYLTRQFLGFFDVAIALEPNGEFGVELLVNAGEQTGALVRGQRFRGRWRQRAGFLFTAVHLSNPNGEGIADATPGL